MKTISLITLSILGISNLTQCLSFDIYFSHMIEEMDEHFKIMENHMRSIRQELHNSYTKSATPEVDVEIRPSDTLVTIELKNVSSDAKKALFSEDKGQLSITTDQDTITIKARPIDSRIRYTSLVVQIEQNQEKTEENKGGKAHSIAMSSSAYMQSLQQDIDLGLASIEYNKKDKTLVISVPVKQDNTKEIPISHKK